MNGLIANQPVKHVKNFMIIGEIRENIGVQLKVF